jgi:predicted ATPase
MATSSMFSRFQIEGLQGRTDIDAQIKDNTLIIVGENGSGKTTFLRILFYFLSGRWNSLSQFNFAKVVATIDGTTYSVNHDDVERVLPPIDLRTLNRLPISLRRQIIEMREQGRIEEAAALLRSSGTRYGVPMPKQLELEIDAASQKLAILQDTLAKTLGAQILYLPTYRRIERELSSIIQGLDPDDTRRPSYITRQSEHGNDFVELVEFGMNDVKTAIAAALQDIRNFQLRGITQLSLSYLGDIVSQSYLSTDSRVIENASEETIDAILNRIDPNVLSAHNKAHLRQIIVSSKTLKSIPSEHERIIYHYFTKLVNFQEELQAKESNVKMFCNLCSEYITDKKFIYESDKISFRIQLRSGKDDDLPRKEDEIEVSDLSSGEKQIVSLFSHLYLSGRERFFVLIDEPELSLSVPWQRRFLTDIRDASNCSGLVAVTHSPFIYDNKLRSKTHALGEFISGPDWGHIR